MEPGFLKRAIIYLSRFRLTKDPKILIFIIFLLLSALFWFLNEINKEQETTVQFPVRYVNIPKGKVLANELPAQLDLQLKGPGTILIRYMITTSNARLTYGLKDQSFGQIANTHPPKFFLLTSAARDMLNRQLPPEVSIVHVKPDTIFFTFDEMVSRKVKVEPTLDLTFEKQFMLSSPVSVEPDSVVISGAAATIDTIKAIHTEPLVFRKLDESVESQVTLEKVEKVLVSNRKVTFRIPVAQFTESVLSLPIEVLNLPDHLEMKLFPNKVTVTFLVALADFEKIQPQLFKSAVDYLEYTTSGSKMLKVNLVKFPDYIRVEGFYPSAVEFIIEKK